MLKVWGRRNAYNVQKAMWAIGETGVAHEHKNAGGSFGGLNDPEFKQMNPNSRVPVIIDNGEVIWESNTIVRYLCAKYGKDLCPTDLVLRARAEKWMDWTLATMQKDLIDFFWSYYRMPAAKHDKARIAALLAASDRHLKLMDEHLATHKYLAGETFSMADIPAGVMMYRHFEMDIARPDVPNVVAWYKRLQERPAYREHVMIPFQDLFSRESF